MFSCTKVFNYFKISTTTENFMLCVWVLVECTRSLQTSSFWVASIGPDTCWCFLNSAFLLHWEECLGELEVERSHWIRTSVFSWQCILQRPICRVSGHTIERTSKHFISLSLRTPRHYILASHCDIATLLWDHSLLGTHLPTTHLPKIPNQCGSAYMSTDLNVLTVGEIGWAKLRIRKIWKPLF